MMCGTNETGLLLARVDPTHPMTSFDGYEGDERQDAQDARVLRDVFEKGDAWFVTGDLMRRDEDDDYWFVDRANDVLIHHGAPLPTLEVEDALLKVARVRRAAVVGHDDALVAFVVGTPPTGDDLLAFSESLRSHLPLASSPETIHWVEALPSTDGFRTQKRVLRESLTLPSESVHLLATSKLEGETYVSAP
jgi:acyl-coenzyme A synthetase/AMP-(fatty) acid ligase